MDKRNIFHLLSVLRGIKIQSFQFLYSVNVNKETEMRKYRYKIPQTTWWPHLLLFQSGGPI